MWRKYDKVYDKIRKTKMKNKFELDREDFYLFIRISGAYFLIISWAFGLLSGTILGAYVTYKVMK